MSSPKKEKPFHITIGAAVGETSTSLESELRLVKAALLYADRAKLCSLKSSFLLGIVNLRTLTTRQRADFFEEVLQYSGLSTQDAANILTVIKRYKELVKVKIEPYEGTFRLKPLSSSELQERGRLEGFINRAWDGFKNTFEKIAKDAKVEGIISAMQSGLLDFHELGTSSDIDKILKEFFGIVANAVSDGSTFPLFDDQTCGLIRASIKEGRFNVSESGIKRGKHTRLASHLLERLPLFDAASVDEVLDIRRELDRSLRRFRAAMMKFSDEIKSAAWDQDFEVEAEQVFYSEIEPAILDIEDAVKSNKYLTGLLRKIYDKPLVLPAGSALTVAMSNLSFLPDLVVQGLGIGLAATSIVSEATREWKDKKLKAEQNHLFFYYRARKELSG